MGQNTVGNVLHYYRKKYHFSAKNICSGICSVATLYRLEDGHREIDSLICETLLSRIGKEVNQFEMILDADDYERWQLRHEMKLKIIEKNAKELLKLVEQYRLLLPKEQDVHEQLRVHEQFCNYCELRADILQERDISVVLRKLNEGLRYTRYSNEKNPLYSQMEIDFIRYRSHYFAMIDPKAAKMNLENACHYVRLYHSKKQREKVEEPILIELIEICMQLEEWKNAIPYLEEAIELLQDGKRLFPLAALYFKKAKCMHHLYQEKIEWEQMRKECVRDCYLSYFIFQTFHEIDRMNEVKNYCEENLKCPIIEQKML